MVTPRRDEDNEPSAAVYLPKNIHMKDMKIMKKAFWFSFMRFMSFMVNALWGAKRTSEVLFLSSSARA
jgi:hypothetical protein